MSKVVVWHVTTPPDDAELGEAGESDLLPACILSGSGQSIAVASMLVNAPTLISNYSMVKM